LRFCPVEDVDSRGASPAVGVDLHRPPLRLASIATTMHWLPTMPEASRTRLGFCTAAVLIDTFVGAGIEPGEHLHLAHAAAHRERNEDARRDRFDDVQQDVAPSEARR